MAAAADGTTAAMLRWRVVLGTVSAIALLAAGMYLFGRGLWVPMMQRFTGKRTIDQALAECAAGGGSRIAARFAAVGMPLPGSQLALLAFKQERRLELWAEHQGRRALVASYAVLAASGGPGPKLREGDRQVPEGIYGIASLNPNSAYHLALRVDYPNADDRRRGADDGRPDLGGDIMIHGKAVSIGCLAMGDEAIEELFTAVARCGCDQVEVVLAPCDLRHAPRPAPGPDQPAWTGERWRQVAEALAPWR
ncbi:MAG: L,D-transpeptidase family protein [Planctomycetes bacterium]|nr:L,D-transpeptidase family protein [Planctomycetota bacterium]